MTITNLGEKPRHLENLSIGGGFAEGGAEMDADGNIAAAGDMEVSGEMSCDSLNVQSELELDGALRANLDASQRVVLAEASGQMIRVRAFRPGMVLHDVSSSAHWFRIGCDQDVLVLSVDTDNDNAVDGSEHFDDAQPVKVSAGEVTLDAEVKVLSGVVEAGAEGSQRGTVTVWDGHGDGTTVPGCIRLVSRGGYSWYLFVQDNGTLRVHNAPPTYDTDGQVVGLQP